MRVQNSAFGQRPNEEMNEIPKYFLIYEGAVTEPMYFKGIIANRKKLSINESLSLISVLRSIEDIKNSHPIYALKIAEEIKEQSKDETISKESLLKSIIDFISSDSIINKEELINYASDYIKDYSNDIIMNSEIENIIIDIYKDDVFRNVSSKIVEYLNDQRRILDYNSDIDVINLIVDRDKGSFKSEQYDYLLKECEDNNIRLYISNPCFEVWLLMHFDEFDSLDFTKLLENKRVTSKKNARKYSDKMLSDIIGYDKSNLKFDLFIDRIDSAIKREKNYCENLKELKNNVGSNIGKLIQELRKVDK